MPEYLINEKSGLVYMMAWSCQATCDDLSQCWPRFMFTIMLSLDHYETVIASISVDLCVNSSPPSATYMRQVSIGSDNGLSPGRRQPIIWTNADILLIRHRGTHFNEILFEILIFSFKKMHLNMSSVKWWPFCPGEDELKYVSRPYVSKYIPQFLKAEIVYISFRNLLFVHKPSYSIGL